MKNIIKERYQQQLVRFRAWQKKPSVFSLTSTEMHHCECCDRDFTGNYCPYCAQKAGTGRITWKGVHSGILDIWGLGTRSLPFTLWQLLLRPGYLIADYISGRRQYSFPPVKMLFIMAVIVAVTENITGTATHSGQTDYDAEWAFINTFLEWYANNKAWAAIIMGMLNLPPVYLFFRHAPRYDRHTLPEGFFIQVFLGTLHLVFALFGVLWTPLQLLYFVAFVVAFRQLFGYSLWGTLWRLALVLACVFLSGAFLIISYRLVFVSAPNEYVTIERAIIATMLLVYLFILALGYLIDRRRKRKSFSN